MFDRDGTDWTTRPWYIAAKTAADATLAAGPRRAGENGEDALPAVWSEVYKEIYSGAWQLSRSQGVVDRSGAAAAAAAPGETASVQGVVGVDFKLQRIHEIIANIEREVFHTKDGASATITIFLKNQEGTAAQMRSISSDGRVMVVGGGARLASPQSRRTYSPRCSWKG